jgi:nucleoside transporter
MTQGARWRLSLMMFLEYFIWAAWLPLLTLYLDRFLHFSGTQIGWIFATQAIASVSALLIGGQLADRYLAPERLLALSHVVGGLAMLSLAFQKSFGPFFVIMLVHMLAYIPTLSLANSICFQHLEDPQNQFGRVRLWGTIGWIAASWPFFWLLRGKHDAALGGALTGIFIVSGLASLALAAAALLLPATRPAREGAPRSSAPFAAIKLLAVPTVAVLFAVTFLDALVHQCYFFWTGSLLSSIGLTENRIMLAMSLGQVAEIPTMAVLGYFLKRLGWRWTMILGILAHAMRFLIYSIGNPVWLVVGSNVVHGLCYAFFFASVYIFVDEHFPKDARASAQGLFNLLILGIGPFAGSLLWGWLGDVFRTAAGTVDFSRLFLVPSALGLLAALVLFIGFHPARSAPAEAKAA